MSTATGNEAETVAASYLKQVGFKIIDRNWKTRWNEIDIVARDQQRLYFVEVKYRKIPQFGDGLEYITKQKLDRMSRACQAWVGQHSYEGDYCLAAVALDGDPPAVVRMVILD